MLVLRFLPLVLVTGCVHYTFTPPLRPVHLESPGVLDRGETAVAAEGAWHATSQEGTMGTGTVRVRRGMAPGLEGSLEATAMHDDTVDTSAVMLRAGVKKCVAKLHPKRPSFDDCLLAVMGGLGGGTFDHGGLFGGDVALVLGFENRYFVPFVTASFDLSVPMSPRSVYDGNACIDPSVPCAPYFNEPRPTFAFGGLLGFRIPIVPGTPHGRPRGSLLGGAQLVERFDGNRDEISLVFAGGADVVF
jgi:hypothetical protein